MRKFSTTNSLNQILEKKQDGMMAPWTMRRPLPSGRLSLETISFITAAASGISGRVFERIYERDDGDVRWWKHFVVRVRVHAFEASALVEHVGRGGRGSDSADDGIRGGGRFEVDIEQR